MTQQGRHVSCQRVRGGSIDLRRHTFRCRRRGAVRLVEICGRLSRDTGDWLIDGVAELWERYEVTTAHDALGRKDERLLENRLQTKRESPLAATVAAIVLLRANRWNRLHDWLRNLANWFPEIPDAAVLWVEQRLRTNESLDSDDMLLLMSSIERGLPRTAEAVGYLKRQLRQLISDDEVVKEPLPDHVKSNLKHALNLVEERTSSPWFWRLVYNLFWCCGEGRTGTRGAVDTGNKP